MKLVEPFKRLISRLNLWSRLVLVLTAGFALLFGVFSLVSLRALDDSTQHILTEREVIAQMAAQRYDELLGQAFDELERTATFAAFDPSAPDLSNEKLILTRTYNRLGIFSLDLMLLDAQGRVILSEPPGGQPIGTDYSTYPFVVQVLQSGQRNISSPFRDPQSGKPAVAITIPIRDQHGRLRSMLSGWIDLTNPLMLTSVEDARELGATGHADLVDEHGIVIVTTDADSAPLMHGGHLSFYRRMLAANRASVENVPEEYGPYTGEMHIMAFAPLTVTHWGIAVGGTTAETFAPVHELQTYIFLFGAFSFAIIFIATLWGARVLVHPVKVLTDAAQEIAAGQLDHTVEVNEGGEIGALAEAFDTMRRQLQHSLSEIRAWGSLLEARVQERTLELQTLNAELQRGQDERQKLLQHVITAQEEERKRVARELHDETGQALTALSMSLEAVEKNLTPDTPAPLRANLSRSKRLTENTLHGLRQLIRDLRPGALDDLGLIPAIRSYAENHLEPRGIHVTVSTTLSNGCLPPSSETVLFRMMQEAVNNIARHATAQHATITLEADAQECRVCVQDDGQGFDPARVRSSDDGGWGLVGMRERANLIQGSVRVESTPGAGTRVWITVPCKEHLA